MTNPPPLRGVALDEANEDIAFTLFRQAGGEDEFIRPHTIWQTSAAYYFEQFGILELVEPGKYRVKDKD